MTTQVEREAEDNYEAENDASPVSSSFKDNSYATETRADVKDIVPVQADEAPVEDPMVPHYADTDEQLAQDESEAVDQSNILDGDRLRHAKPSTRNQYSEGANEDELPSDIRDGLSGVSGTKRLT